MPRYMIEATNSDQLREVTALARLETRVFATSEKRLFVSTGDLSPEFQRRLRALGARVVRDNAYDLEAPH